jgi:hypothetical protein
MHYVISGGKFVSALTMGGFITNTFYQSKQDEEKMGAVRDALKRIHLKMFDKRLGNFSTEFVLSISPNAKGALIAAPVRVQLFYETANEERKIGKLTEAIHDHTDIKVCPPAVLIKK